MKNVNVDKILEIMKKLEENRITLSFRIADGKRVTIATTRDLVGFFAATRQQKPEAVSEFLVKVQARRTARQVVAK